MHRLLMAKPSSTQDVLGVIGPLLEPADDRNIATHATDSNAQQP